MYIIPDNLMIAMQQRETQVTEFLFNRPKFLPISKIFYHHLVLHITIFQI